MIPYAYSTSSKREQWLFEQAVALVKKVPNSYLLNEDGECGIRCHELARAVHHYLPETFVQDGWFEHVEHSWLWTEKPPVGPWSKPFFMMNGLKIIDVYQPGSYPQVVCVDYAAVGLPWRRAYSWTPAYVRNDINETIVQELIRFMGEDRRDILLGLIREHFQGIHGVDAAYLDRNHVYISVKGGTDWEAIVGAEDILTAEDDTLEFSVRDHQGRGPESLFPAMTLERVF